MKKNQKKIAINKRGSGDFKVYVLYPENAIADTGHKKQQQIKNTGFETALNAKELHGVISINTPYTNPK